MKTFLLFLGALILGILVWLGINFTLLNYKGGHGPFRAQDTLHRMQQFV